MAKQSLFSHPKLAKLQSILPKQSRSTLVGSLELLWHTAYEFGNPLIGDSGTVEAICDWKGAPGQLSDALFIAGFLEKDAEKLKIHDLEEHEPDYVKSRRRMKLYRTRLRNSSEQFVTVTPIPSPPLPSQKQLLSAEATAPAKKASPRDPEPEKTWNNGHFDGIWIVYPKHRHVKKAAARRAWAKHCPKTIEEVTPRLEKIHQRLSWFKKQWSEKDPEFTPHLSSWLNAEEFA